MRAIKDTVIIEPIHHIKLKSGIFIGAKELENPTGLVIAAGEGRRGIPLTVKKGDTVAYRDNVGQGLEYDGNKYLVLKEHHIIGITQ